MTSRKTEKSRIPRDQKPFLSLSDAHPELAEQWHPLFNGDNKPEKFHAGSVFEAWWLCPRAVDHVFKKPICSRTRSKAQGKGCPFCHGELPSIVKPFRTPGRLFQDSFAATHPVLAQQWDRAKNGKWEPSDFTAGSVFEAYWICFLGHRFKARIASRARTRALSLGCRECFVLNMKNNKARAKACLAITHPRVARQWASDLNGSITPFDVTKGSGKKVWWRCPKGEDHVFESIIARRTLSKSKGFGCPMCYGKKPSVTNSLESLYPDLTKEYSRSRNKLPPSKLVAHSGKKVFWHCDRCNSDWKTSPADRIKANTGCPKCNVGETIDLTKDKKLFRLFDNEKNPAIDPKKVKTGTVAWWRCNAAPDHVYQAGVYRRKNPTKINCPFCRNEKTSVTNSLATCERKIAKEWHPTRNGKVTPRDVRVGSSDKYWWKCPKGEEHEWLAPVSLRVRVRTGCPFCKNKRASKDNNLAVKYPDLAKQLHPTKNSGITALMLVAGSGKNVWWLCEQGHEYQMRVVVRTLGGGKCRKCKELKSPKKHTKKIVELYKQGMSTYSIGKQLGYAECSIRYLLNKLDVYRSGDAAEHN